jgi:cytochrome c
MSTARQWLPGGALALIAIADGLCAADVFDGQDMQADSDAKRVAPESPPAAALPSTPKAPNDLAGDPPRAELTAPSGTAGTSALFQPPPESAMPAGEFGDVIRRGREIFIDTPRAAPA